MNKEDKLFDYISRMDQTDALKLAADLQETLYWFPKGDRIFSEDLAKLFKALAASPSCSGRVGIFSEYSEDARRALRGASLKIEEWERVEPSLNGGSMDTVHYLRVVPGDQPHPVKGAVDVFIPGIRDKLVEEYNLLLEAAKV